MLQKELSKLKKEINVGEKKVNAPPKEYSPPEEESPEKEYEQEEELQSRYDTGHEQYQKTLSHIDSSPSQNLNESEDSAYNPVTVQEARESPDKERSPLHDYYSKPQEGNFSSRPLDSSVEFSVEYDESQFMDVDEKQADSIVNPACLEYETKEFQSSAQLNKLAGGAYEYGESPEEQLPMSNKRQHQEIEEVTVEVNESELMVPDEDYEYDEQGDGTPTKILHYSAEPSPSKGSRQDSPNLDRVVITDSFTRMGKGSSSKK